MVHHPDAGCIRPCHTPTRAAVAQLCCSVKKSRLICATMTERYVRRTSWLGFPDTIAVRFLDRPEGASTLALYSRSKFGEGDLGVNRARIERWLAKLSTIVGTR
jgi:uncharacterized protein (DUF1499 family)